MEIKSGSQSRYQIGYHMVWGVKYHKHLLNKGMKKYLVEKIKDVCKAYGYDFYCIGLVINYVHFFVGAAPKIAPAKIVQVVKSITAKEMFVKYPQVKKTVVGRRVLERRILRWNGRGRPDRSDNYELS